MRALRRPAAFSRVSQLAEQRGVHLAFQWLHLHGPKIMQWQAEVVAIAAPPFSESARAEWLADRFRELGLTKVGIDAAGNALGTYAASSVDRGTGERCVLVSAHIDTVFPLATPIRSKVEGDRLTAPGACDNGAGIVALLAIAAALRHGGIAVPCDLLFAGNVGEEGEGDLRGMRQLYSQALKQQRDLSSPVDLAPAGGQRMKSPIILAHLVIDGAGHELAVTSAVGSRRYLATIEGSGGHSWSDAGRPNPIVAMSRAIASLAKQPVREDTRWNVGTIEGGTSVNSIPEVASARFDLRSTDAEELIRLEVELHRALEDAVFAVNSGDASSSPVPGEVQQQRPDLSGRGNAGGASNRLAIDLLTSAHRARSTNGVTLGQSRSGQLRLSVEKIGDRPAGRLAPGARILETLLAVDRHLGIHTGERSASTDANIPLSLGREALSIGAGGEGGGVHTSSEWYDARNRELGLRRILLLLLALAESA
ncbi:MAG TPA: M20/M25/M40 family metallo-hydrolase [Acidisarcina sp.]